MQVTEEVISLQSPVVSSGNMLYARFAAALRQLLYPSLATDDWRLTTPLAIALSGGADSMALTLLADQWARAHGGRIVALTVDHGLRPESRREAEKVAAWMRERDITHRILTPPPSDSSSNVQENARQRRYDALADFCREHDILHCLLAHHAGDQRETVELHTTRGSTADGGTGMAAVRNYCGVRFLRPLLTSERTELEDFLCRNGSDWVRDPSNENTAFARVRTRAALAEDKTSHTARDAQAASEAVARIMRDEALAEAAAHCVTLHPLGFVQIDYAAWHALEPTLGAQLLADCLRTIGGHTRRPRRHETEWLATALREPFHKRTLHHCEIAVSDGHIHIARELARVEAPLTLQNAGEAMWDRRFRVHYTIPPESSLTLRALRHDGKKQLAARFDQQVDLPLATPSFWHLDELCYIPHMNATMSLPPGVQLSLGFAPPKPLAAAPFWWLSDVQ